MMIQLRRPLEPVDTSVEQWFEAWLEIDALRGAVAVLPNSMRFVTVEHYWGGRGLRSLASELQLPEARIGELLLLAREWIRCELRAQDTAESTPVLATAALR